MFLKTLRPYQREAFERAKVHEGFALFGEQRTGKTPIAAALIDYYRPDRLLIFTVKKGIVVWEKEFNESLRFDVGWYCDYKILNYEVVRNPRVRRQLYRWLASGERSMTIADESHHIKRRGSKQSKTVRNCGKRSKFRLALSGTPIAQGIHDAWAQMNFVNPRLFGPWEKFALRFLLLHGKWKSKVIGHKNLEQFYKLFHRYSFRRTLREARAEAGKSGLKVRSRVIRLSLGKEATRVYTDLEKEMYSIIPARGKPDSVTAGLVITQTMKLQQVTGGYVIADSKKVRQVGKHKLNALGTLVSEELGGARFVVVARFLHEIRAIKQLLERSGRSVQVIAGGTKFSGRLEADVAVLQIQSGSAIDLAAANSIIFFSWDYSYINLEQTKFRILSFDTDRINYYWLMVNQSIDELLYSSVRSKEDLAKVVCDYYRNRRSEDGRR